MKVALFNGSPHKEGNTFQVLRRTADVLESNGVETTIIHVGNKSVRGCMACGGCSRNRDEKCVLQDDVNAWVQEMKQADGIILGTPVYYSAIAGTMKCFLDRAFYVGSANGGLFRHKPGAAFAIMRRSGGVETFDQLNHYFTISEMPVVSAGYWNAVHGRVPGEVLQDAEGMQVAEVIGENMAWMLKLIENGRGTVAEPPKREKIPYNFIR